MLSNLLPHAATALLLGAVVLATPACNLLTTCSSCTAGRGSDRHGGGCGWCASSSTCTFGTAAGPLGGSCRKWEWDGCGVPSTPAPTGGPFVPVDKQSPPWTCEGGDSYHSYYIDEEIGSDLFPEQRYVVSLPPAPEATQNAQLVSFGDFVVVLTHIWGANTHSLNATVLNASTGTLFASGSVPLEEYYSALESFVIKGVALDVKRGLLFFSSSGGSNQVPPIVYAVNVPACTVAWTKVLTLLPSCANGSHVSNCAVSNMLVREETGTLEVMDGQIEWTQLNSATGAVVQNVSLAPGRYAYDTGMSPPLLLPFTTNDTIFNYNDRTALVNNYYGVNVWSNSSFIYSTAPFLGVKGGIPGQGFQGAIITFYIGARETLSCDSSVAGRPVNVWSTHGLGNPNVNLQKPSNIATDGQIVFLAGNSSSSIQERFVATGELNPTSPVYEAPKGGKYPTLMSLLATKDHLIGLISFQTGDDDIAIWSRTTGKLVKWEVPVYLGTQIKEIIYRGGWLFVVQGARGAQSVLGIQLRR